MTRSRRRNTPITDRVVRIYEVIIWPDESDDGPYDPFTITLSYPSDAVPEPYTDKVKRDALKQARKEEVKAGRLDDDSSTVFELTGIKLVRSSFIKAENTLEAQRVGQGRSGFQTGDKLTLRDGRFVLADEA